MRKITFRIMLSTLFLGSFMLGIAHACAFSPEWNALQTRISSMTVQNAADALQKHIAYHENIENCELEQAELSLSGLESQLISVKEAGRQYAPQMLLRCNVFNPSTAQCQSPMEDATAHPRLVDAKLKFLSLPAQSLQVVSQMKGAKLLGVYQTSLVAALDGKPASKLGKQIILQQQQSPVILMAIYKTKGPWRYRKAIWYFE